MTTQRSEARDALVKAMANASLFEVVQQARERRDGEIKHANDVHDQMVQSVDAEFVRTVISAAIELDGFILTGDPDVVAAGGSPNQYDEIED